MRVCYVTPHRARLQQEYEKRKRKNKDLAIHAYVLLTHRARLQQEYEKRKRKNKDLAFKDFIQQLGANESNHDEPMFHYETCNTSAVDIRSFKDYFVTTLETLLISQRKLHIKVSD